MYVRPVWPAILCVIGASAVALFFAYLASAFFLLASNGYASFGWAIATGIGVLIPTLWFFGVSMLLLLDRVRKLVWGVLPTATFGFASIISVLIFVQIWNGTPVGSIDQTTVMIAAAGPLFGLAGAV